jgi:hypothetical protein
LRRAAAPAVARCLSLPHYLLTSLSHFVLCFQQLPTSFSRNSFPFTFIRKPPGGGQKAKPRRNWLRSARSPRLPCLPRGTKGVAKELRRATFLLTVAKSDELTIMESHSYAKHRGRGVQIPKLITNHHSLPSASRPIALLGAWCQNRHTAETVPPRPVSKPIEPTPG